MRKTYEANVELKAGGKGEVVAAFSIFNEVDSDSDIVLPGAITDGVQVPMSAFGHGSWQGALPVGKGTVSTDSRRATFHAKFFDTMGGRETYETLKQLRDLAQWSWGFDVAESERGTFEGKSVRYIKKVHLYEVSPVLVGANQNTRTLAIKNAKTVDLAPHERAIVERAYRNFQRDELERIKARLDAELCVAEVAAARDRFMKFHGHGWSSLAESFVDPDVKAAAWSAVHRFGPRLGLNADAITVKFFTEEIDTGRVTKHGDKVDGSSFGEFFSLPGTVIRGITRPALEPTVIRINADLNPDTVTLTSCHELAHLAGADEEGAVEFESRVAKEIGI